MTEVKRIALGLRYDGSRYHGWQVQDGDLPTVQGRLEQALTCVANHPVTVTCAGRTDAGVHASSQVVHFDSSADRRDYSWVFGANSNLPPDISVLWAKQVNDDFSARYSAVSRTYRYLLYNYTVKPAILRHGVGWYHKPLDEKLMQRAADYLVGEHDFTSFRGAHCQSNTPMRNVQRIDIIRKRRMLIVEITANAFLQHMVRNIVGLLLPIGSGAKAPEWAQEVLQACDRTAAGVTIAPNGLYLVKVTYPPEFRIPETPIGPFFLPD